MKKILILGGTRFVGRILTEKLITTDHNITLFNREKSNPGLFPEVNKITGDRETEDIAKIAGQSWVTVIDFSGFFPPNLKKITVLLEGKVQRYIFVSSGSVYDMEGHSHEILHEDSKILDCTKEQYYSKDVYDGYGEKKAECERILLKSSFDIIIFRPGLIYGRYDPTDRLYYWLYRAAKNKQILLPENGTSKTTNTYSEDFASLIFEAITIDSHEKIYNANTHDRKSLKEIIETACDVSGSKPELINASFDFLKENKISEWSDIPLWIHDDDFAMDNSKLLNDFKYKLTPLEESIKQTYEYYSSFRIPESGISLEKEQDLIKKILTSQ